MQHTSRRRLTNGTRRNRLVHAKTADSSGRTRTESLYLDGSRCICPGLANCRPGQRHVQASISLNCRTTGSRASETDVELRITTDQELADVPFPEHQPRSSTSASASATSVGLKATRPFGLAITAVAG